MPKQLSDLICDLIDAKSEVVEYFKKYERNPYRTHPCEDDLSSAKRALDEAVADLTRKEGMGL